MASPGPIDPVGQTAVVKIPGYAQTYHPSSHDLQKAATVSVTLGQETQGIDITLIRTRTHRVAGAFLDAAGRPLAGIDLLLIPSSGDMVGPVATTQTSASGVFGFAGVPSGDYVLQNIPIDPARGFGSQTVSVSDHIAGIMLRARPPRSVRADLIVEADSLEMRPREFAFRARSIDFTRAPLMRSARVHVTDDGRVNVTGAWGAHRLDIIKAPAGFALKAVRVGGDDVTGKPIDFDRLDDEDRVQIVVTNRTARVNGKVTDDRGQPCDYCTVVIWDARVTRWDSASSRIRRAVTDAGGVCVLTGLLPGDYVASAVARMPLRPGPEFIESLRARGVGVTLREGAQLDVLLKVRDDAAMIR